jgi:hypothetical protein
MTKPIERDYRQMFRDHEVAQMLGVPVAQVGSWATCGKLKGLFRDRRWWFGRMELIQFAKERKERLLKEQDQRRAKEIEEIRQRILADAPKIR